MWASFTARLQEGAFGMHHKCWRKENVKGEWAHSVSLTPRAHAELHRNATFGMKGIPVLLVHPQQHISSSACIK